MDAVADYLQVCFSGANLPATALLILASLYWLSAIVAGLDLELLHFDLGGEGDADVGDSLGIGAIILRSLNIGRVPSVIWGSVFALTWWLVSVLLDRLVDNPQLREQWFVAAQYAIRNAAIAIALTKLITQPLRGKFDADEPHPVEQMLGRQCRVTSSEVTERFGQAEFVTGAAPLRIHVRTRGGDPLLKGDAARIVAFDTQRHLYYVERAKAEGQP